MLFRSVFKLSNRVQFQTKLTDSLSAALSNYPSFTLQQALDAAINIENILKTNEIDVFDFLNEFQELMLNFLKNNLNNKKLFEHHIKLVQTAKKRLKASMSVKVVLESLFLSIVQTTR